MSRDLQQYEVNYKTAPFEHIQAAFRRESVLEQISKFSPQSLLEVGCGTKPLFTDLPDNLDVHIIEPSSIFADNARQLADEHSNVKIVQGFVEEVDVEQTFDMVILSSVLHESPEPQRLLRAVHQVCHSGTIVHVNVPNASSMHRQLALSMNLIPSLDALSDTQIKLQQSTPVYDGGSLKKVLDDCGYATLETGGIFIKPFTHAQMQELVDGGFMTDNLLRGLYNLSSRIPELASEIWINARKRND